MVKKEHILVISSDYSYVYYIYVSVNSSALVLTETNRKIEELALTIKQVF